MKVDQSARLSRQRQRKKKEAAGEPSQDTQNGGSLIPTISTQRPFRSSQAKLARVESEELNNVLFM